MSNIEPIKEENDIKSNSPQKQQNINNNKVKELTLQNEESFAYKSKRIFFKNEENKRDNCLSPRMKNSLFMSF
jgi:hypothetical protein